MKTIFIQHKATKLACIQFGEGHKALLCFHGYGLTKNSFLQFQEKFGDEFTIYSFDLFAHGKSEYGYGESALSIVDWKEMINSFLDQEKIERFSILAFSMGGKVALCTYECFESKIDKLILIAPDGIKTSFWYQTATYPGILNKFFRFTIFHPNFCFKAIRVLKMLRLVDKSLMKFVEFEMNTAQKRARIYFSWMIYRNFKPDLTRIQSKAAIEKTNFIFYTGKYDNIIRTKDISLFCNKIESAILHELNCGHTNLIKKVAQLEN